jgi:hypothetical protein
VRRELVGDVLRQGDGPVRRRRLERHEHAPLVDLAVDDDGPAEGVDVTDLELRLPARQQRRAWTRASGECGLTGGVRSRMSLREVPDARTER